MKRQILHALVVVLLCATDVLSNRAQADVTFSDGTFSNADWSLTVFQTGASASASQQASGGNPGSFRLVTLRENGPGFSSVYAYNIRTVATYDPHFLAISSLDWSEDTRLIVGFGNGEITHAALTQDGKFYYADGGTSPSFSWIAHKGTTLTPSQFFNISDSSHPDFSTNGGPISFGFMQNDNNGGSGTYSLQQGIDNWSVVLHTYECGCGSDGDYLDPSSPEGLYLGANGESPDGNFIASQSQTFPYVTIQVRRVADSNLVVVAQNVPGGTAYGFSPGDKAFAYFAVTNSTGPSDPGSEFAALYKLAGTNSLPLSPIWTFQQPRAASVAYGFSPHARYFVFTTVNGPDSSVLKVIDTSTGHAQVNRLLNFFGSPIDDFQVAGWGFSPDGDDRTFVYAYSTAQFAASLNLANLPIPQTVLSQMLQGTASWQFSPCGDVFGLLATNNLTGTVVSLYHTLDGSALGSPQTFNNPNILLSVSSTSHVATVGGTANVLAANTARNACVTEIQSAVAMPGNITTVSTSPKTSGQAGVTASLDNTAGAQAVAITAATYASNPRPEAILNLGTTYLDLIISGASGSNSVQTYFYYPSTVTGAAEIGLTLKYYAGTTWAPVFSSGGALPVKSTTDNLDGTVSGGLFAVVFDNTSTPKAIQLTGTPFALDTTPPALSISLSGGSAVISWASSAEAFVLQQNSNLTTTNWAVSTTMPFLTNGWNQVFLTVTNSQQFYRLMRP
jgi:hypothetical protein